MLTFFYKCIIILWYI